MLSSFFFGAGVKADDGNGGTPVWQNASPPTDQTATNLTAHSPIVISGNLGFNDLNGIISGNGTSGNPYIIANYLIDASATDGITISNTNAFFIIENCEFTNGSFGISADSGNNGITLNDVSNGLVTNCSFINSYNGIALESSSNINLTDNTFQNCGLFVDGSYNNTVVGNTVNGLPLIYLEGASDQTIGVTSDAGQVVLVNCTGITVSNLEIASGSDAIELFGTVNSIITDNTLNNDDKGLDLIASSNNALTNNGLYGNGQSICLGSSSNNNTISGNTCDGNTVSIMSEFNSNNNTISGNTCTDSYNDGIWLWSSSNNIINNNICSSIGNQTYGEGIALSSSSNNNTISGNTCDGDHYGIELDTSSNNNTLSYNTLNDYNYGVSISSSNLNTLESNEMSGNWYGVYVYGSLGTTIYSCSISGNYLYGVLNNDTAAQYVVNATYNWWGSANGPNVAGNGTGDNVSSNVLYQPWLNQSAITSAVLTYIGISASPTSVFQNSTSAGSIITVTAYDQYGYPMANIPINLILTGSAGSFSPSSPVITASNGQATTTLTLASLVTNDTTVYVQAYLGTITSQNISVVFSPFTSAKTNTTTPTLSLHASSTSPSVGTLVTLSGTMSPSASGTLLIYQSINGSSYQQIGNVSMTNGSYSYTYNVTAPGTYKLYTVFQGNNQMNSTQSPTTTLTALTSATPVTVAGTGYILYIILAVVLIAAVVGAVSIASRRKKEVKT